MLFLLVKFSQDWLEAHGLGFLRVFSFVTFQATVAVVVSFLFCILLGPHVIEWLRRNKLGDLASFDQSEMDRLMKSKTGTPTMGGVLIIASIVLTVLLLGDLRNFYVQMGLIAVVGFGAIGAFDDWMKLTAGRRAGNRQGLEGPEKLLGQLGLAAILSYFIYRHGQANAVAHELYLPFIKHAICTLGIGLFILLGVVTITGFSNAVNLSDGLDGLAGGCTAIVSFVFLILALLGGIPPLGHFLFLPVVPTSDQMAVLAGAMLGACLGFLWFNCNPARVFMGDTGSLALGGLIAYIAIVLRQEFTLVLVGGVFVLEAVSVIIQRYYFKYTRLRYGQGKRFFLMAPIHHHFQHKGWTETQVVVRFWLLGAMLAAMAIATVKLR
jgi:phospho-N-acetylmuramoyl-pentapeptide-transferase